jgi:ankyrin repeat protein
MFCCRNGNPDFVEWLLEFKADVNLTTPAGETALDFAISNGASDCVRLLFSSPDMVDINALDVHGSTVLHRILAAPQAGYLSRFYDSGITTLVEAKADVTVRDKYGTPAWSLVFAHEQHWDSLDELEVPDNYEALLGGMSSRMLTEDA